MLRVATDDVVTCNNECVESLCKYSTKTAQRKHESENKKCV